METYDHQVQHLQKKLEAILARYHAGTITPKAAADDIVKIREEIEILIKRLKVSQN